MCWYQASLGLNKADNHIANLDENTHHQHDGQQGSAVEIQRYDDSQDRCQNANARAVESELFGIGADAHGAAAGRGGGFQIIYPKNMRGRSVVCL